jgi:hypothetical protein
MAEQQTRHWQVQTASFPTPALACLKVRFLRGTQVMYEGF